MKSLRASVGWFLFVVVGIAALAGCTNTNLVDVWKDPSAVPTPMHSMLVIAAQRNATERRLWEDAIVAQLRDNGVEAVPSYSIAPDQAPSQSEMASILHDRDLDGSLIITPLVASRETHWVPGFTTVEPRVYYNPWTRTNTIVDRAVHRRGYRVVDHYAREQITLWSPDDGGRMVLAGTTETLNPTSGDDLRQDLARAIVPGMEKEGFIDRHAQRSA